MKRARLNPRHVERKPTSPAVLLAAAIGGIVHVKPDAAPADTSPRLITSKLLPPSVNAELERIDWDEHKRRVLGMWCLAKVDRPHRCTGGLVAHHAGLHGTGIRSLEAEMVPLCDGAHRALHDRVGLPGMFGADTAETVRDLETGWALFTQRYLAIPITVGLRSA